MAIIKGWKIFWDKGGTKTWQRDDNVFLILGRMYGDKKFTKVLYYSITYRDDSKKIYKELFRSSSKKEALDFASNYMKNNTIESSGNIIRNWEKITDKKDQQSWENSQTGDVASAYKNSVGSYTGFYNAIKKGLQVSDDFKTLSEAIDFVKPLMKQNSMKNVMKKPRDPDKMSWKTFVKKYQPIKTSMSSSLYDGFFIDIGEKELKYLNSPEFKQKYKNGNVWTIIDVEGEVQLVAGARWVNRLGYIVTKKAWSNEDLYVIL